MARHLVLLYHFFHPDDVISARLYSELGAFAGAQGWKVTALPSTRSCHAQGHCHARQEIWNGVHIRRIWRPGFSQSSTAGRLLNTLFMLVGWTWRAIWMKREPGEIMVVGTDPIFAVLIAIPWRIFRPRSRIVHWCHDLHPEASLADGQLSEKSNAVRALRFFLRFGYRRCDVLVDLGPCMRQLLSAAAGRAIVSQGPRIRGREDEPCDALGSRDPAVEPKAMARGGLRAKEGLSCCTITPWSLAEPPGALRFDAEVRYDLFGSAKLALLYSGNLGRAHDYDLFLQLVRTLQMRKHRRALDGMSSEETIRFCFAGRGVGMDALKQAVDPSVDPICFAGFACEDVLEKRLSACDIHLVSLKDSWTGTVVPSKFFGALAMGRPVLFVGAEESTIAHWIRCYEVGWVLTKANLQDVAETLEHLCVSPGELLSLNEHCWRVYQDHFSRDKQISRWIKLLEDSIQAE